MNKHIFKAMGKANKEIVYWCPKCGTLKIEEKYKHAGTHKSKFIFPKNFTSCKE